MHLVFSFILFIDTLVPFLLHNPIQIAQFHISRSNSLYRQSVNLAISHPNEAVRLAIRAQNHVTLIEENIRQITNPLDVPYADIQQLLPAVTKAQDTLLTLVPASFNPTVIQLQSF